MTLQLEGDRRLLQFTKYEEYLDSLIKCYDLTYLQSTLDARKIAELGYRTSGDTLTREQFHKRLEAATNYFFPTKSPTDVITPHLKIEDRFLLELARREEGNRDGYLATIIFIRNFTKKGFEVSGFIDYADRIRKEDWTRIFLEKKPLWPNTDDLGFYHWRNDTTSYNNSLNFKVIMDEKRGLSFECWHDRKIVNVDPYAQTPGWHTSRIRIQSKKYAQIDIYDHLIRRRC